MSNFRRVHKILEEIVFSPHKYWRFFNMADNRFCCGPSGGSSGRETVCIEANRILDSCRDRDCFEDVRVILTDFGNDIIERTTNVRTKSACIAWTYINIEPVQFNRGFYTVTIRYYCKLVCEACVGGKAQEFEGVAVVEKNVVLYGSESNVSVFRSTPDVDDFCASPDPVNCSRNAPRVVVEAVDPIILKTRVLCAGEERKCYCCCCACDIPEAVTYRLSGNLCDESNSPNRREKYLAVSIGIFSVCRLVRPAQYLINAVEYSVPDKECVSASEGDPCNLFRTMAFPTGEFSTPSFGSGGGNVEKRCGGS